MTRIELPGRDIIAIRAPNPSAFTLTGTNSWIVGRDPAWLIDPGPAIEVHLDALGAELDARGGLGGIAVTHDHPDHVEALPPMRERYPEATVAGARGPVDLILGDGSAFGPLEAVAIPGHSRDHYGFVLGDVLFSGDAILGEGSVFISPYPGALNAYLDALERLRRNGFDVLAPAHGPIVSDVDAYIQGYLDHRLERERRLIAALEAGRRTADELLDEAWSDAPEALRPAAAATLAAHLDKLAEDGRLPEGVERPDITF